MAAGGRGWGAHSFAEEPGLGHSLPTPPPPFRDPFTGASPLFNSGPESRRKGHLLSPLAQPGHRAWPRTGTPSRLLGWFPSCPQCILGLRKQEGCRPGLQDALEVPPPGFAPPPTILWPAGKASWECRELSGWEGVLTSAPPVTVHLITSLAGERLGKGWVFWQRQESSGALPGFP